MTLQILGDINHYNVNTKNATAEMACTGELNMSCNLIFSQNNANYLSNTHFILSISFLLYQMKQCSTVKKNYSTRQF